MFYEAFMFSPDPGEDYWNDDSLFGQGDVEYTDPSFTAYANFMQNLIGAYGPEWSISSGSYFNPTEPGMYSQILPYMQSMYGFGLDFDLAGLGASSLGRAGRLADLEKSGLSRTLLEDITSAQHRIGASGFSGVGESDYSDLMDQYMLGLEGVNLTQEMAESSIYSEMGQYLYEGMGDYIEGDVLYDDDWDLGPGVGDPGYEEFCAESEAIYGYNVCESSSSVPWWWGDDVEDPENYDYAMQWWMDPDINQPGGEYADIYICFDENNEQQTCYDQDFAYAVDWEGNIYDPGDLPEGAIQWWETIEDAGGDVDFGEEGMTWQSYAGIAACGQWYYEQGYANSPLEGMEYCYG
jgi:hypothetical protein